MFASQAHQRVSSPTTTQRKGSPGSGGATLVDHSASGVAQRQRAALMGSGAGGNPIQRAFVPDEELPVQAMARNGQETASRKAIPATASPVQNGMLVSMDCTEHGFDLHTAVRAISDGNLVHRNGGFYNIVVNRFGVPTERGQQFIGFTMAGNKIKVKHAGKFGEETTAQL